MTRKDYVKLAAAFKATRPADDCANAVYQAWVNALFAVIGVLTLDNPRFDGTKFLAATR